MYCDKFPTRQYKWRITFSDPASLAMSWKQWDDIHDTVLRLGLYGRYRMDVIIQELDSGRIRWNYIEFIAKRDMAMFMLAYNGPK